MLAALGQGLRASVSAMLPGEVWDVPDASVAGRAPESASSATQEGEFNDQMDLILLIVAAAASLLGMPLWPVRRHRRRILIGIVLIIFLLLVLGIFAIT